TVDTTLQCSVAGFGAITGGKGIGEALSVTDGELHYFEWIAIHERTCSFFANLFHGVVGLVIINLCCTTYAYYLVGSREAAAVGIAGAGGSCVIDGRTRADIGKIPLNIGTTGPGIKLRIARH